MTVTHKHGVSVCTQSVHSYIPVTTMIKLLCLLLSPALMVASSLLTSTCGLRLQLLSSSSDIVSM